MSRLAILGASGHGRVLADTAECCGWGRVEFFDDGWPNLQFNHGWSVCGDSSVLLGCLDQFDGVLVAIGDNRIRQVKLSELLVAGARLATLIHPSAVVSRYSMIEPGSVVLAGAVVSAGVRVGLGAILNTGCSVDHDCLLGAAVHISPGARLAGAVHVGDLAWVGIGASVRQSIRLGSGVMVGAGAAVVSDVADGLTVVGVPARVRL